MPERFRKQLSNAKYFIYRKLRKITGAELLGAGLSLSYSNKIRLFGIYLQ